MVDSSNYRDIGIAFFQQLEYIVNSGRVIVRKKCKLYWLLYTIYIENEEPEGSCC